MAINIKQVLKDHEEDLKNNNLDSIYNDIMSSSTAVLEFKDLLLEQNIHPLKYMTKIPFAYFYSEEYDILDLSSYTNIKFVDSYAFSNSEIDTLVLPQSVQELKESAFRRAAIRDLDLPEGIKEIPEECFRHSRISKLKIPESVLVIQSKAFYDANIDTLYLPSKLKEVNHKAFNELMFKFIIYKGKEYSISEMGKIFEVLKSNGVQVI